MILFDISSRHSSSFKNRVVKKHMQNKRPTIKKNRNKIVATFQKDGLAPSIYVVVLSNVYKISPNYILYFDILTLPTELSTWEHTDKHMHFLYIVLNSLLSLTNAGTFQIQTRLCNIPFTEGHKRLRRNAS